MTEPLTDKLLENVRKQAEACEERGIGDFTYKTVLGLLNEIDRLKRNHHTQRVARRRERQKKDRARADLTKVYRLAENWASCWCPPQQYEDHDPRVRDCPQHGSDDCRHMAEGIVKQLRDILGNYRSEPEPF